jgi:hypothetical protein
LTHEPFLIVLDDLERILLAYARMDAASSTMLGGRSKEAAKGTDQRVGAFSKLARSGTRLVSSRLSGRQRRRPGSRKF